MLALTTRQKIFFARQVYYLIKIFRSIFRLPATDVITYRRGCRWKLNLKEGIDFAIYLGIYEGSTYRTLKRLVKDGNIVLDIGANIGAHTLPLSHFVGEKGKVIACEATEFACQKLNTNIALNPNTSNRIHAIRVVLAEPGAAPKTTNIYSSWPLVPTHDSHPVLMGVGMSINGTRVASVDEILKENSISHVDLIKLDVDGNEVSVLRGASSLLASSKPVIVMELAPYLLEEHGYSFHEMIEILRSHGYVFRDLSGGSTLPSSTEGLLALCPPGKTRNVIASVG